MCAAEVERMELAQATTELRQSITRFSWLKILLPGLGGLGRRSNRGVSAGLAGLLREYPLLSSLVSLIVAKPLRSAIAAGARPALKWGGLAFVAWEAWRIWQRVKATPDEPQ